MMRPGSAGWRRAQGPRAGRGSGEGARARAPRLGGGVHAVLPLFTQRQGGREVARVGYAGVITVQVEARAAAQHAPPAPARGPERSRAPRRAVPLRAGDAGALRGNPAAPRRSGGTPRRASRAAHAPAPPQRAHDMRINLFIFLCARRDLWGPAARCG